LFNANLHLQNSLGLAPASICIYKTAWAWRQPQFAFAKQLWRGASLNLHLQNGSGVTPASICICKTALAWRQPQSAFAKRLWRGASLNLHLQNSSERCPELICSLQIPPGVSIISYLFFLYRPYYSLGIGA